MRSGPVLDVVLNKLEARDPHSIKREVVEAAGGRQRQRLHSFVLKWLHPRAEDWRRRRVALLVNTANGASAVVEIEVRGKFAGFCLGRIASAKMVAHAGG